MVDFRRPGKEGYSMFDVRGILNFLVNYGCNVDIIFKLNYKLIIDVISF